MDPRTLMLFGLCLAGRWMNCWALKIGGLHAETTDAKISMEKVLVRRLLKRYSQYGSIGRPVSNTSHSVEVKFALSLIQIITLEEKDQVLTTSVWFNYIFRLNNLLEDAVIVFLIAGSFSGSTGQWQDILLQWDPAEYDGLTSVRVPSNKIWIPDIVLYNFADTRLRETRDALVVVTYNGSTLWMPQAILKSACPIDITFFPFDEQRCYLKFGSWSYDGSKLDLVFQDNASFLMSDYLNSHEWDVVHQYATKHAKYYLCCPDEPFVDLKYHLRIRRRVAFYSFILILPCTLLSLMTLVIFWVPPESPAKLQLDDSHAGSVILAGMNIFVAFFVLLLLLADSTPRASVSIPLIGAYYCLNMVMITVSTVLACFSTNMFFRGFRRNRAPRWLRVLMVNGVAKMLFFRHILDPSISEQEAKSSTNQKRNCFKIKDSVLKNEDTKMSTTHLIPRNTTGERLASERQKLANDVGWNERLSEISDNPGSVILEEVVTIRRLLEGIHYKRVTTETHDKYLLEWRIIAVSTDRLFFVIYIVINILSILFIMYSGR